MPIHGLGSRNWAGWGVLGVLLAFPGVGRTLLVSVKVSNASEVDFHGANPRISSQHGCAGFSPLKEQSSLDFGTIFVVYFSGGN